MTSDELYQAALRALPFEPQGDQDELLSQLCQFAVGHAGRDAFVLQGYAGTGKTSVMAALTAALRAADMKFVLLAPTGRAAKVLSAYSGAPASTIHKRLYRGDSINPAAPSHFFLAENKDRNTLFIVDEASMIAARSSSLLTDLVGHVYSAPDCAMILVGDTAQLPPVGEEHSAAMDPNYLAMLGLRPYMFTLSHPLRQAARSGILYNAIRLRRRMERRPLPGAVLWPGGFPDIEITDGRYLSEQIADSYRRVGEHSTLVITRSNGRASAFNRAIRATVMYAEDEIQTGERLVIAKNNYFWTKGLKDAPAFIANGESAQVLRITGREHRYGHNWADVDLLLPDSGAEFSAKLLLTCLDSEYPNLPATQSGELYNAVLAEKRAEGIGAGSEMNAMRRDPYINALQAKYGYALTCHKAQGGQWEHVYVDLGGIPAEAVATPDLYRWLYTALTRAVSRLYLISPSIPMKIPKRKA